MNAYSTNPTRRTARHMAVVTLITLSSGLGFVGVAHGAREEQPAARDWNHSAEVFVTQDRNDVRQNPLSTEDQALVKRWAELFAAILGEFLADHRDPTASMKGDFSTLELRIRRITGTDDWVDRKLTKKELTSADLRELAKQLYNESKKPR